MNTILTRDFYIYFEHNIKIMIQINKLSNNTDFNLNDTSDPPHKPTDETTAEEFRDLLNLNLISYFLASKVTSQATKHSGLFIYAE